MDLRLLLVCWTACFLGASCASPMRTFVSDDRAAFEDPFRPQAATSDLVTKAPSVKAEANPVKLSVWSQWMGTFSKQSAGKESSKPAERIPLPRTDLELPEEGMVSEHGADGDSDF